MGRISKPNTPVETIDSGKRRLLEAAGAGAMALSLGGVMTTADNARAAESARLRWGFVGTGGIANNMAPLVGKAANATLAAVSSRKMERAEAFASKHGIEKTFDSWSDMVSWKGVDAIYVATPTSVREEICVAAARNGKHVLGEKPFANLPSLRRITQACRDNGVAFMDGTHFVHQARNTHIKTKMQELVGWPWSIDSAFQFGLTDPGNIRMIPDLEPYGAIGDAGWYNMRAAVEYSAPELAIANVDAYLRRSRETGAVISGSGVIVFSDGSTTTWNCGFESGAGIMDLRISGATGVIKMDDFISQRPPDRPAGFEYRQGWSKTRQIEVPAAKSGAVMMFEDFSAMVGKQDAIEASIRSSERTQLLLDAVWNSAIDNEKA
jgi:predicted dehydrogenase